MRFRHEGASQRNTLTLSAGERDAAFADDCVVTLIKGLDELIRLGRLCRRFDLSLGCFRFPESDILADSACEQLVGANLL